MSDAPQTKQGGNENTAAIAEPIEKSGGDSITSFDELELVSTQSSKPVDDGEDDSDRSKPSKSKEKAKEQDDAEEDQEDDDSESDDEESGEEEEKDEEESSDEESEEELESKELDKNKPKSKIYKVKQGDSEVDLAGDATMMVTVNGKPQKVNVQELINNYSGKTDWTRKYHELHKERQTFDKDRTAFQEAATEIYTLGFKNKDAMAAMNSLGSHFGWNMQEFWKGLTGQLEAKLEEYSKLTPEERRAKEAEEELALIKKERESEHTRRQQETVYRTVESQVTQIQKEYGIDDKRLLELHTELKNSGAFTEEQLGDPSLIAKYHVELEIRQGLSSLMKQVAEDMSAEERDEAVDLLRDIMRKHPDLSWDDVKDLVKERYGNQGSRNLSRKLNKSKPTNTAKPSKARIENPISFDDLQ